jgi:hypothetical protein
MSRKMAAYTLGFKVVRLADDRLRLTLKFASGEELEVRIARAQLLEQLNIKS